MKKFFVLLVMVGLIMAGTSAFAANTVDLGATWLRIVLDGATDFEWATATATTGPYNGRKVSEVFPNGLPVTDINLYTATAGTVIIVRDKSTTGQIIPPKLGDVTGGSLARYLTGKMYLKPSILNSEQTTPTNAEVGFVFK